MKSAQPEKTVDVAPQGDQSTESYKIIHNDNYLVLKTIKEATNIITVQDLKNFQLSKICCVHFTVQMSLLLNK